MYLFFYLDGIINSQLIANITTVPMCQVMQFLINNLVFYIINSKYLVDQL